MAAPVHHLSPQAREFPEPLARFFAVPAVGEAPERPRLRVIPGGREAALRHRRPAAVYGRRRAVAAAVAAGLMFVSMLGVGWLGRVAGAAVGAAAGAVGSTSGPEPDGRTNPLAGAPGLDSDEWVVEPGDTLWSIASELRPEGDVRPVVDELARRNGGAVIEAGERLDVGGLRG